MTATTQEARQPGPAAAGALDPEAVNTTQRLRPPLERGVATGVGRHGEITEPGAVVIDGDGDVDVLVGVHTDDHLSSWLIDGHAGHWLFSFIGSARQLVGWADRTVTGRSVRRQAPIRSLPSRPASSTPDTEPTGQGRQINAKARSGLS
jgi:hypothetical protein